MVNAVIDCVKTHGVGAGGTRNISGTTMHHELLEHDLVRFFQYYLELKSRKTIVMT